MITKTIFAIVLVVVFLAIGAYFIYLKTADVNTDIVPNPKESVSPLPSSLPLPIVSILPVPTQENKIIQMENGLKIQDLKVGTGLEAKSSLAVAVNYLGTFENGTKFDSSYDRGKPFQFVLGTGSVIRGWDIGVAGMKVGGKRKLIIPPALAYGEMGSGSIPPNSTLVFEVELLAVQTK